MNNETKSTYGTMARRRRPVNVIFQWPLDYSRSNLAISGLFSPVYAFKQNRSWIPVFDIDISTGECNRLLENDTGTRNRLLFNYYYIYEYWVAGFSGRPIDGFEIERIHKHTHLSNGVV